jgi:hypothetical protein
MRRGAAWALSLLMIVASGLSLQPGLASADPLPWTWVAASAESHQGTDVTETVTATCPEGYRAFAGGVDVDHGLHMITISGRDYSALIVNGQGGSVQAWCVLSSQVDITIVDRTLVSSIPLSNNDWVGRGDLACDGDQTPVSASVRPSDLANQQIDQSGPENVNGVNEWYVSFRGLEGSADVQLLCVPNSQLGGVTWYSQSAKSTGNSLNDEAVTGACPSQQRMITGGAHVDSIDTYVWDSLPNGISTWYARATIPNGDTLTVSVLCGPAGDPVATIISGPPRLTNSTTATFTFDAFDPAGGDAFDPAGGHVHNYCFLNTSGLGDCRGSYTVNDLSEGQNVFSVEAYTNDGRGWAPTEKDYYFWVDLTPPTVTLKTLPLFTLGKRVNLHATGSDDQGLGHYTFNVAAQSSSGSGGSPTTTAYDSTTGDVSLHAVPGDSYKAAVTAYDQAGNASVDTGTTVITGVPLDNSALDASKQWSLIKGNAFTHRLVSRTTAYGATLRHVMYGNTLGLVATTCKTCGAVGVYVGKHLIKRVGLRTTRTLHRQVIAIPVNDNAVKMNVTLKVLSHHKRVEVDGLGAVVT